MIAALYVETGGCFAAALEAVRRWGGSANGLAEVGASAPGMPIPNELQRRK